MRQTQGKSFQVAAGLKTRPSTSIGNSWSYGPIVPDGGGGFQKSVVYQNFAPPPPPPKKKIDDNNNDKYIWKLYSPLAIRSNMLKGSNNRISQGSLSL